MRSSISIIGFSSLKHTITTSTHGRMPLYTNCSLARRCITTGPSQNLLETFLSLYGLDHHSTSGTSSVPLGQTHAPRSATLIAVVPQGRLVRLFKTRAWAMLAAALLGILALDPSHHALRARQVVRVTRVEDAALPDTAVSKKAVSILTQLLSW
jgi:hypothetical protein